MWEILRIFLDSSVTIFACQEQLADLLIYRTNFRRYDNEDTDKTDFCCQVNMFLVLPCTWGITADYFFISFPYSFRFKFRPFTYELYREFMIYFWHSLIAWRMVLKTQKTAMIFTFTAFLRWYII